MRALICQLCLTVVIVETAPAADKPLVCRCLDNPPFTRPLGLMRLRIPEGYELRRIGAPS